MAPGEKPSDGKTPTDAQTHDQFVDANSIFTQHFALDAQVSSEQIRFENTSETVCTI